MSTAIVLLGHGTKDADGTAEFLQYVEELRRRSGWPVSAGVLEYPSAELPDIQEAFRAAAASGASQIVGLPALLHFAGHARTDMPAQLRQAQDAHPELDIRLAGPLGFDDRLLAAVELRLAGQSNDADTAVLLVGRGSLDDAANADLFRTARMLWSRNRYGSVEAAFVSLAPPDVACGIERCVRLGARTVLVAPYFLNDGVLVKRIAQQASHASVDVRVVSHIGVQSIVCDVMLDRLAQARTGMCPCRSATGCRLPALNCAQEAACLVR